MLYIAKEIIEDGRSNIKNNNIDGVYDRESNINNFTVHALATPISKYNCYKLNVKVLNNNKEIELNTYVTKKK